MGEEGIAACVLLGWVRGQLAGNSGLGDCDRQRRWPAKGFLLPRGTFEILLILDFVVGTGNDDVQRLWR
jgi:hypothetical protein